MKTPWMKNKKRQKTGHKKLSSDLEYSAFWPQFSKCIKLIYNKWINILFVSLCNIFIIVIIFLDGKVVILELKCVSCYTESQMANLCRIRYVEQNNIYSNFLVFYSSYSEYNNNKSDNKETNYKNKKNKT